MKAFDDIALVTQVAVLHNRRAFDQLVVKYQSSIRRFFLLQTGGDVALSDDLAQETFVKAYVNITHFRGLSRFSTWLYRIAYNTRRCAAAENHRRCRYFSRSTAPQRNVAHRITIGFATGYAGAVCERAPLHHLAAGRRAEH